jgi:hypothetical protein
LLMCCLMQIMTPNSSRQLMTRGTAESTHGGHGTTGGHGMTSAQQTTKSTKGGNQTLNQSRLFAPSTQHVKPPEVDVRAVVAQAEAWVLHLRVRAHILHADQVLLLPDGDDLMARCFSVPPRY